MSDEQKDKPLSWEFRNNLGYVGGVDIYTKDKEVAIWIEDDYYDFQIPFDKFLEIAEKVKELDKKGEKMSIEITDELTALVQEFKHYGTEATARHLAAYICEELDKEEK